MDIRCPAFGENAVVSSSRVKIFKKNSEKLVDACICIDVETG
jgi:hypothetical protein